MAPATLDKLRRRGCLVVRGHFPREQALQWDQGVVDYLESNRFFKNYRGPETTSSPQSVRSPRFTRSTGRLRKCRPDRAKGWLQSRPF